MRRLTAAQARRYAIAAQGLDRPRTAGKLDRRHFRKVVDTLGLVQLDSVNVFSRAHYMPFFSRLGPYDRDALDDWLWRSGEIFEYWGHEASLIPMTQHPVWRWRTKAAWRWHRLDEIVEHQPDYFDRVLDEVRINGPLQARDLTDPGNREAGEMWGWSKGKIALEYLFLKGEVSVADRVNFTRLYAVTPDVIPEEVLALPVLEREDGQEALVEAAARSMGVATLTDLADYPRFRVPDTRPVVDRLVERGRLQPVEVDGWDSPGYLHPEARLPRAVVGRALLSPFDNLIWCRPRVERLWDFIYRIEIYVPEAKRVHGYYVLPFLLDGDLVARVDLKTDRQAGRLLVKGAWAETGVDRVRVGRELRSELESVAGWLGVDDVEATKNGDLAGLL